MTLPPPIARRERAIVLVHGAWVGEWSFTPILPLLEASGRPVHLVSLTGHGSRRHTPFGCERSHGAGRTKCSYVR